LADDNFGGFFAAFFYRAGDFGGVAFDQA